MTNVTSSVSLKRYLFKKENGHGHRDIVSILIVSIVIVLIVTVSIVTVSIVTVSVVIVSIFIL